jgi:glutaminase
MGETPVDLREHLLFEVLDEDRDGRVHRRVLVEALHRVGLDPADDRLAALSTGLATCGDALDFPAFRELVRPNLLLVEKAVRGDVVIPDWPSFSRTIEGLFREVALEDGGEVADYIPQLGRVDPARFGLAICTADGQRLAFGDADVPFCVQSTCKPVNYVTALEEWGTEVVHRHVGREPSGRGFNELTLDFDGKPHNPMINAGAIMTCSLIRPGLNMADRFDHVMTQWRRLSGGHEPGFSNAVYLSERATADRNFALGYMMRERGVFPEGTDLVKTLEFYFQCCSIEMTASSMAVVAATLARGGQCPLTDDRVLGVDTARACLSLMQSCGMYDFSGEFAFSIGLPAKSGVSGAVMVVVPNVLGLCIWSPALDRLGNSVRGLAFCRRFVETFAFHPFDDLTGGSARRDPRIRESERATDSLVQLTWAAFKGDLSAVQRELARGADASGQDYDGRTPLHLAAAEGHLDVVRYLLSHGARPDVVDRWGATPLDDARRGGHEAVVGVLESMV